MSEHTILEPLLERLRPENAVFGWNGDKWRFDGSGFAFEQGKTRTAAGFEAARPGRHHQGQGEWSVNFLEGKI